MPVTLKDIAERVGLSIAQVSRALGDFDDVSPRTREEIRRVAREMGYEPNVTARSLQKRRTDTIALIVPATDSLQCTDSFFGEFLSGVAKHTADRSFNLIVAIDTSDDERQVYLKHVRARRVDGFIVVQTQRQDSRVAVLLENDVPFVAFGRVEGDNPFHLVDEDDALGMRLIVDHLASLGHRRLGCIAQPSHLTKGFHRLQGFLDGLQAHNLAREPSLLVEADLNPRAGKAGAELLLDLPDPPTAVVACSDILALGAMAAARERQLVVGQDVSITGYEDIRLAEFASVPLTTVSQPTGQIGRKVAEMLVKLIKEEAIEQKQIILAPSLVVRQSTGPPR
jgi:LacI family transcriptional regulator